MRVRESCFLALVLFVTPGLCFGQETKKSKESLVTLDEVVVTGTRSEEKVERIPANVTVIDRSRIEDSNAKNISDWRSGSLQHSGAAGRPPCECH
jgi:outer membrane cobalamin receptor